MWEPRGSVVLLLEGQQRRVSETKVRTGNLSLGFRFSLLGVGLEREREMWVGDAGLDSVSPVLAARRRRAPAAALARTAAGRVEALSPVAARHRRRRAPRTPRPPLALAPTAAGRVETLSPVAARRRHCRAPRTPRPPLALAVENLSQPAVLREGALITPNKKQKQLRQGSE